MLFSVGFIFMFYIRGLSGVMFAKAYLDIALDDTYIFNIYLLIIVLFIYLFNLNNNFQLKIIKNNFYFKEYSILLDKDYFEQFFIGLLEVDETITVDYINNLKKRLRIFISLKNIKDNVNMLNIIFEHISGRVKLELNNTYVTLYATS